MCCAAPSAVFVLCLSQMLLEEADALGAEFARQLVQQQDADGTSVLMAAAAAGNVQVARQLLHRGAEVGTRNDDGHTALMFAHNGKRQEEVLLHNYRQYVLEQQGEAGEGVGVEDEGKEGGDGVARLIEEAMRSHDELIALLLERGADPTVQV